MQSYISAGLCLLAMLVQGCAATSFMWDDVNETTLCRPKVTEIHYDRDLKFWSARIQYETAERRHFLPQFFSMTVPASKGVMLKTGNPFVGGINLSQSEQEGLVCRVQEQDYAQDLSADKAESRRLRSKRKTVVYKGSDQLEGPAGQYDATIHVKHPDGTISSLRFYYFDPKADLLSTGDRNALVVPDSLKISQKIQRKERLTAQLLTPFLVVGDIVYTPYFLIRSIIYFDRADPAD